MPVLVLEHLSGIPSAKDTSKLEMRHVSVGNNKHLVLILVKKVHLLPGRPGNRGNVSRGLGQGAPGQEQHCAPPHPSAVRSPSAV